MGYSILIPNGILSMCYTDVVCPFCKNVHDNGKWHESASNSKKGYIYRKCTRCKSDLGIAIDFKGDTHTWLKCEEKTNFNSNS